MIMPTKLSAYPAYWAESPAFSTVLLALHEAAPHTVPMKQYTIPACASGAAPTAKIRLVDQIKIAIRTKHCSRRTEEAYVYWARQFILFHRKRHPIEMAEAEVAQFLEHLAVNPRVLQARKIKRSTPWSFFTVPFSVSHSASSRDHAGQAPGAAAGSANGIRSPETLHRHARPAPADGETTLRRRIAPDGVR